VNIDELGAGPYVLLTTFRKDGTAVPTPLWGVRDGDAIYVWTPWKSGKVKRIKRSSRVQIAPCTARGAATGPAAEGDAELLDAEGTEHVRRLLRRKFPIQGRVVIGSSTLFKGRDSTVGVRITLT
jgi:PPOX class probable F420-dependent enzyme